MKKNTSRSLVVQLPDPALYEVLDAALLMAKNVYNPMLYLLRNAVTAYTYHPKDQQCYSKDQPLPDRIHADLNGAFNIIRKACAGFNTRRGVDLSYEWWGHRVRLWPKEPQKTVLFAPWGVLPRVDPASS